MRRILPLVVALAVFPARAHADDPLGDLVDAMQTTVSLGVKVIGDALAFQPGSAPSPAARPAPRRVELPRRLVDEVLDDPAAHLRGVRPLPAIRGLAIVGVRIDGIEPGGLLARIGLENGDVITAVNGRKLTGFEAAIDAYHALRRAPRLEAELLRRGQPVVLEIVIRER